MEQPAPRADTSSAEPQLEVPRTVPLPSDNESERAGQRLIAAVDLDMREMALQALTCVALKARCKQIGA
eukprot:16236459-Heterocapsa_arctica.AAC.1